MDRLSYLIREARRMTPTPRRLVELDALRGLAALCVLLYHAWFAQALQPVPLRWLFAHSPLHVMVSGRQPVVFFFVLSGFVLSRALLARPPPGWANYALQRALRLGLPVAGALVFSLLLFLAVWQGPLPAWEGGGFMVGAVWTEAPTPGALLLQALLLGHDGQISLDPVLWSLVHEWRISLLLPGVLLFRGRARLLLALGVACTALAHALGGGGDNVALGPDVAATLVSTLYFMLPFCVGGALALATVPVLPPAARRAAGLAVLVLACFEHDLASVVASALLIVLALRPGPGLAWLRGRVPVWLGKVSFSLYLVHLPLMAAAVHLYHPRAAITGMVALAMLLALPAAALLHRWVEQPAHRLARWVARRPWLTPAPAAQDAGA